MPCHISGWQTACVVECDACVVLQHVVRFLCCESALHMTSNLSGVPGESFDVEFDFEGLLLPRVAIRGGFVCTLKTNSLELSSPDSTDHGNNNFISRECLSNGLRIYGLMAKPPASLPTFEQKRTKFSEAKKPFTGFFTEHSRIFT